MAKSIQKIIESAMKSYNKQAEKQNAATLARYAAQGKTAPKTQIKPTYNNADAFARSKNFTGETAAAKKLRTEVAVALEKNSALANARTLETLPTKTREAIAQVGRERQEAKAAKANANKQSATPSALVTTSQSIIQTPVPYWNISAVIEKLQKNASAYLAKFIEIQRPTTLRRYDIDDTNALETAALSIKAPTGGSGATVSAYIVQDWTASGETGFLIISDK